MGGSIMDVLIVRFEVLSSEEGSVLVGCDDM
jgi:hypothetical protein